MSQYSEIIGSFIRTGDFPLEADYVFSTLEALQEYYEDEVSAATIYQGLIRVVLSDDEGEQSLYWVTKNDDDELEFTKLVSATSSETLSTSLETLQTSLEEEIAARKSADTAIWGTSDSTAIPDGYNSINDLYKVVLALEEAMTEVQEATTEGESSLLATVKAIAGTTSNDIISYLETLSYTSLTELSKALNTFLNESDSSTTKINTLPELQAFLNGYTEEDTLADVLDALWNKIEGDSLPTTTFQTLRGIEDYVRSLSSTTDNSVANLQTELDQTQVGVGLSGDGSYSADQETYYLQNATSVMNALKILDSLVYEAISNITITVSNDDVVELTATKQTDSYVLSGFLNISDAYGNGIIKKDDGIYMYVTLTYSAGVLSLLVNGSTVASHSLASMYTGISGASYDSSNEAIILTFDLADGSTEQVSIPVAALAGELVVDNSGASDVVELTIARVTDGNSTISGDVRISTATDNILQKDGNSLYVSGSSDSITYNDTSLTNTIDSLVSTDEDLQSQITSNDTDIVTLQEADTTLQTNIQIESEARESADTNLQSQITSNDEEITALQEADEDLQSQITSNDEDIASLQTSISTLESTISTSIQTSVETVSSDLETEVARATAAEEALSASISTNTSSIETITTDLSDHIDDTDNPHEVTKEQVGLGNVDNTSDLDKPISTATQEALDEKAPIYSPILTGVPMVEESPDDNDSSQRIPSTNWVNARISEAIALEWIDVE